MPRGGTRADSSDGRGVASLGTLLAIAWATAFSAALGLRVWNALDGAPLYGYDAWGHIAYVLFLDVYGALPWADQGWSYFHPPLRYLMGWLLAGLGSSEALLRGLSLLGSIESVAVAALAAWTTRIALPGRPALALLAFVAVAFLPVHVYVSPMVGNEMTSALWSSATLAALVWNERRETPRLPGDALTGIAAGLALLAKFSGALVLATALAVPLLRGIGTPGGVRRGLTRAMVVGIAAALLAGPFYLRNLLEFGTPFRMSREDPLVADVERAQPPGKRGWLDFVSIPPRLFVDPNPRADHLLHSVWGTLYVTTWSDTRLLVNDVAPPRRERTLLARRSMMALGVVPTLLAALGAAALMADLRRGRRREIGLPLLASCGITLASVVWFAIQVPTYAALKSSYLLGLSVPYGVFAARGAAALADRSRWLAILGGLGVVAAASATFFTERVGGLFDAAPESWLVAPVRAHFGEHDAALALYQNLILSHRLLIGPFSEGIASTNLAAGQPERADSIYRRLERHGITDPWSANQYAVARALVGDRAGARRWLDVAVERGGGAVALSNRAALRLLEGDVAGARADLEVALAEDPGIAPAWRLLAEVNARSDRPADASQARDRARRAAVGAPRGAPHGIAAPLGQSPAPPPRVRWMLRLEGDRLDLALPPYRQEREARAAGGRPG